MLVHLKKFYISPLYICHAQPSPSTSSDVTPDTFIPIPGIDSYRYQYKDDDYIGRETRFDSNLATFLLHTILSIFL